MTIGPVPTSGPTATPPAPWRSRLGRVGVWSIELRTASDEVTGQAAAELEAAGFRSLWIPGMGDSRAFTDAHHLLQSTRDASVVIGVQSIWRQEADELAAAAAEVESRYPARLLTGLGISGAEIAHAAGKPFTTALGEMGNYLDRLDRAATPLPRDGRLLGSLGPKMARLAGARTVGLHPFLVPAEANTGYRDDIGADALLAPHLAVVLDTDARRARETARNGVGFYLGFYTYQANLRRLGFTDEDLVDGGSDRLIDALVAHGDLDAIRARIRDHLDAGADHVTLHVVTGSDELPSRQWTQLAALLPEFE